MKIEHIAIWVKNIDNAKDFFVKYFDGTANDGYYNPSKEFRSYFIKFSDGSRLELMNIPGLEKGPACENAYGYAHIAFSVGSKEKVLELTEQLRKDGFSVVSEPRTTGDGYFESCVLDSEGNRIEITV